MNYEIRTVLPTFNEYIEAERTNKYAAASMKRNYTCICSKAALQVKNKIDKNGLYDVVITWNVTNKRIDADNIYHAIKYILDGLVASGALAGDSRKHIRHIQNFIFTKDKYSINVELKEVVAD
jgi:hypothetical protein